MSQYLKQTDAEGTASCVTIIFKCKENTILLYVFFLYILLIISPSLLLYFFSENAGVVVAL